MATQFAAVRDTHGERMSGSWQSSFWRRCNGAGLLPEYALVQMQILPSLLAADVGRLADEARRAEAAGGDALHLDIMDGHFVPNLSFGPAVVAMARRVVRLPLNVHLMLSRPDRYAARFIEAGAAEVLIHVEAECALLPTLAAIRAAGARCGLTLKPATPAEAVFPFLASIDAVLCMSVEPGYGGQAFQDQVLPKLAALRREADRLQRPGLSLLVDGGITCETGARCAAHGADKLIAGSALFGAADMAAEIRRMRTAAAENFGRNLGPAASAGGASNHAGAGPTET